MAALIPELMKNLPQEGVVRWIGVRPARRETMQVVDAVEARLDMGLVGDRYAGRSGKRQVTLIQHEHLAVMASLLGCDSLAPELLRRNIAVSGINLLALKDREFRIGGAVMKFTGLCHPCSYMEELFGSGGYNAVRGHGGITAQVIMPGVVRLDDSVRVVDSI